MSSPSSNKEGNDGWLMKMELKREEPGEINKEDRIKKDHIIALKGIIQKLEELLRSMCDYPSSPPPSSSAREA